MKDALRLGCVAIGYTIYPGCGARNVLHQELRELILEAKEHGLPTVVWAYPRGAGLSKEGETAVDVIAYAAQIAASSARTSSRSSRPRTPSSRPRRRRSSRSTPSRPRRWPTACATSCRAASTASASSSSRAARPRTPRRCSRRSRGIARRRRLRLDHGPQRLPAPARRGAQAARGRDGHLPGQVSAPAGAPPCRWTRPQSELRKAISAAWSSGEDLAKRSRARRP